MIFWRRNRDDEKLKEALHLEELESKVDEAVCKANISMTKAEKSVEEAHHQYILNNFAYYLKATLEPR